MPFSGDVGKKVGDGGFAVPQLLVMGVKKVVYATKVDRQETGSRDPCESGSGAFC